LSYKILIITMEYPPVSLGGAATVPQYQAEGLAELGYDTHVMFDDRIPGINQPGISKQIRRAQPQPQKEHLTLHPVQSSWPFSLDLYSGYATGLNPSASKLLKSLISEINPDIFHFHNYCLLGDHLINIASRTGKPVFISVHDFWPICPAMVYLDSSGSLCHHSIYHSRLKCFLCCLRQKKPFLSRLFSNGHYYQKKVSRFIVSNDYLRELMVSKGFPLSMIEKVSYALDNAAFTDLPDKKSVAEFRQIHNLTGKTVILYTGKLHKTKGIHVLIDAFKIVQAQNPDLSLVLVGDGIERQYLEKRALTERDIHFLGKLPQHELLCAYETCDIFVMPPLYPEFFSISSHEAMLCKKPVVATNYAALPEFIVAGENGLLFERGDVAGLADALRRLVSDEKLRAKLGQRGYDMARQFTVEKHVSHLLRIYENASRGI
jgi:glycosyltransferase involved in cell wall biosynthesis